MTEKKRLQVDTQKSRENEGSTKSKHPFLNVSKLQVGYFVRRNCIDFSLAEVLQQVVRKHNNLVTGCISVGNLAFSGRKYEDLSDFYSSFVGQREDSVPQLTCRERMRIRLAHLHLHIAKHDQAQKRQQKESRTGVRVLHDGFDGRNKKQQGESLHTCIDHLLQQEFSSRPCGPTQVQMQGIRNRDARKIDRESGPDHYGDVEQCCSPT